MTTGERIRRRVGKAVAQYHLISEGDKILVGLSGGKDSLCLLQVLAERSRIHHPAFTVEAVHVRMENIPYESDGSYLQQFCQQLGVPLHVVTTSFEPSDKKPACFLCSWNRRKQLFNMAQQLGCNKLALGHHQDDIILTALMNLTFQGHFSTMPVLLRLRKMPLAIIRPLCMVEENDIRTYAQEQNYRKQQKLCPYERATNRTAVSELFSRMQALNPEARYSMWNALEAAGKLTETGES